MSYLHKFQVSIDSMLVSSFIYCDDIMFQGDQLISEFKVEEEAKRSDFAL